MLEKEIHASRMKSKIDQKYCNFYGVIFSLFNSLTNFPPLIGYFVFRDNFVQIFFFHFIQRC